MLKNRVQTWAEYRLVLLLVNYERAEYRLTNGPSTHLSFSWSATNGPSTSGPSTVFWSATNGPSGPSTDLGGVQTCLAVGQLRAGRIQTFQVGLIFSANCLAQCLLRQSARLQCLLQACGNNDNAMFVALVIRAAMFVACLRRQWGAGTSTGAAPTEALQRMCR